MYAVSLYIQRIFTSIILKRLLPFDVKVELGRFDTCNPDVTSSMLSVSSIQLHPEYQYLTRQNDLALLRLHTFIPYHRRISPICLPTPRKYIFYCRFFHLASSSMSLYFMYFFAKWLHKKTEINLPFNLPKGSAKYWALYTYVCIYIHMMIYIHFWLVTRIC